MLFKALVVLLCCGHSASINPSYSFTAASTNGTICGASLFHDDLLLTAASCYGAFAEGVLMGGTALDGSDGYFLAVEREVRHPDYTPESHDNNVMIVKLKRSASNFTKQPLNGDDHLPLDGAALVVNGFSKRASDTGLPDFANDVNANKLDHAACTEKYLGVDGVYIIDNRVFCSVTADPHQCHGNMGDPVLDGHNSQVGIVAGGSVCDTGTHPTLNVRVSAFKPFLRAAVCQLSGFPPDACPKTLENPTSSPIEVSNSTIVNITNASQLNHTESSTNAPTAISGSPTSISGSPTSISGSPTSSPTSNASTNENSSSVPTMASFFEGLAPTNGTFSTSPTLAPTSAVASAAPSLSEAVSSAATDNLKEIKSVSSPGNNPAYAFNAGRSNGQFCGATLIHDDLLLTAASCLGAFSEGALLGGTWLDGSDSSFFPVDREIQHPGYIPGNADNNLMIIKLRSPATNFSVQTLNTDGEIPLAGSNLIVNGFSRESSDKSLPAESNDVIAQTVGASTCKAKYAGAVSGLQISEEYLFCSSTVDPNRCHGNLGDPVIDENGAQVGIVAGGSDCNTASHPTLNLRVSTFRGFFRAALCQASSYPPATCPNLHQANTTSSEEGEPGDVGNNATKDDGTGVDSSPTSLPSSETSRSVHPSWSNSPSYQTATAPPTPTIVSFQPSTMETFEGHSKAPTYHAETASPTRSVVSFQPSSAESQIATNKTTVEGGNTTVPVREGEDTYNTGRHESHDVADEGHVVGNNTIMFNNTNAETVVAGDNEFAINGTGPDPARLNSTEIGKTNTTADEGRNSPTSNSTGLKETEVVAIQASNNGTGTVDAVKATDGLLTGVEDSAMSSNAKGNHSMIMEVAEAVALNETEAPSNATSSSATEGRVFDSEAANSSANDSIADVVNGSKHQVLNATNLTMHSLEGASDELTEVNNASSIAVMADNNTMAKSSGNDDQSADFTTNGADEAVQALLETATPGPTPTPTVMTEEADTSTPTAGDSTVPTIEPTSSLRGTVVHTPSPTVPSGSSYKTVTSGPANTLATPVPSASPTQTSPSTVETGAPTEASLLMKAVGAVLPVGLMSTSGAESKMTEASEESPGPTHLPSNLPTPAPSLSSSLRDETDTTGAPNSDSTAATNATSVIGDDFSPLSGNDDLMAHMMESFGLGWWNETKAWWSRNVGDKLAEKCPAMDDCELMGFHGSSYHLAVMGQCIPICDTTRSMQVIGFECGECVDNDDGTVNVSVGNRTRQ